MARSPRTAFVPPFPRRTGRVRTDSLRRTAVAMSAALLAVAAGPVAGAAVPAAAPQHAAHAGPRSTADGSTLTKTVRDVTSAGRTTADHGDTLGWSVAYHDAGAGGPAPATVTDAVTAGQSYVPGSLSTPPGWTPSWSTDGTTFTATDPGGATTAVRATNPAVSGAGTGVGADLLPPVQSGSRSTGGDGFTPVLHHAASGDVEAWNIYHHTGQPARLVVCNDLSSGRPCAGGPWPRPLNTTAGPLGSGDTSDVFTTLTPQYVLDPARAGVLYYPAVTSSAVGVGCLDLGARANCGFTALLTTGTTGSSANGLAGLVQQGGDLYGVASTGQVLCMTLADRAPCAGQPYAAIVPPNHDLPGAVHSLYQGAMVVADGKVYASSAPEASGSTAPGTPALGCYDPATGGVCAGWTTPHPAGPDRAGYTYSAYAAYDTSGRAAGVCTTDTESAGPATTCYALDGDTMTAPATGLDALPGATLVFNPDVVTADGDTRSYFGVWGGPLPGDTLCYSWTHAQPCAGFPAVDGHPGVNGGATRDYGYTYDDTTRCLIGLGDAGVLFSLDPATGASPCVHSGASVTLRPADFYCDGTGGHVSGYTQARLEDIDLTHANLAASTVTVTDSAGTVLATPALPANGVVDLSGISATGHPAITVTVRLVLTSTSDFTAGHPGLTAAFRGDDPQVCLRTTVAADCAISTVHDTATGNDATGDLTSNAVSVPVAPGNACQPHVTVNKQICTVASADACGPGGSAPWAKSSPVGLLRLLGTAHWRITVTNTGPVGAAGVTVNDRTTPACRNAAGTFTLAAGASRQVYCSSFLLALPVVNTASATYTPVNAPHGTAPTTSPSSSATACSLLCGLAVRTTTARHA